MHTALSRKSKYWLIRNQNNVGDMFNQQIVVSVILHYKNPTLSMMI
jgi:hypothetical protein